jgi:hypothetical protein
MKIVAADSKKPNKLDRHIEAVRAECVGKTAEFFQRWPHDFIMNKTSICKNDSNYIKTIACVVQNSLQNCQM